MLNKDKTGLQIFENFETDRSLPKFIPKNPNQTGGIQGSELDLQYQSGGSADLPFMEAVPMVGGDWIDQNIDHRLELSRRMWKRIFRKLFGWAIPKIEKKPKLTVIDFFKNIKGSLENIEIYQEKVQNFINVAEHAAKMGQEALLEEIMRDVNIIKAEALLLGSNFKTVITEQQIIKFYKESERGLQLHYVKNFGRVIPLEVAKLKQKADQLLVFDNYVVLYYDKGAKTFKETQEEVIKRKDPILFGLIKNSRKLYYIADWIDEYCDLTLKELIDKFGDEAIKANDLTVKYKKHDDVQKH
jgi:hypothetical protein